MKRESFNSRLGFILVSAGCAIGIGNVWKFPYLVGQNGGGLFVLIYLVFLALIGVPILSMELAIGRASHRSVVQAYKKLEPVNSKWHIHGWIANAGCMLLMMYYTTVSGWMLDYAVRFLTGQFAHVTLKSVDGVFAQLLGNPVEMMAAMMVTVIGGFLVCSFGLQKGLEKITKVMMSCLLGLIILLAIHSITLKGGMAGLKFYLMPSLKNMTMAKGIRQVVLAAMSQAFFTLSVGIGAMEIFGSYMSKDESLLQESMTIASLDTFVAIVSGLIIFPACFAFGVSPDQGPSLIFVTLPKVFINMPLGRIWGTLFFVFMTFASFSTVMAVFENLIASAMDNFQWSRKKATVIFAIVILVLSTPCALGYNLLSDFNIAGKNILDIEDFLVSNILLPLGSLIFLLFCVTKYGWKAENFMTEANLGKGIKVKNWMIPYFRYVLPILIIIVLGQGLF
ncbi:sodium-dependent transporter [Sharpea porci]|uniref:sodium-dependent transporter n=1 Tax=Sharpea porci TaxID=2652286 RepID=UPI002A90A614|nr:sodium-dependent transporter [Sharpea porci]MDY5279695.1 sodium-dependent transporter [Sharpea porci]